MKKKREIILFTVMDLYSKSVVSLTSEEHKRCQQTLLLEEQVARLQ